MKMKYSPASPPYPDDLSDDDDADWKDTVPYQFQTVSDLDNIFAVPPPSSAPNPFYEESDAKMSLRLSNLKRLAQMFPDRTKGFIFKTYMKHHDLTKAIDELLANPNEGLKPLAMNKIKTEDEEQKFCLSFLPLLEDEEEEDLSELSEAEDSVIEGIVNKSEETSKNPKDADNFKCPICKDDINVEDAVMCRPNCKICILCFIKSIQNLLNSDSPVEITKTECFLNCGNIYSLDCMMDSLPPVLVKKIIKTSNFYEEDKPTSSKAPLAPTSASIPDRLIELNVEYRDTMAHLKVPDHVSIATVKTLLQEKTGVPSCKQNLRGWKGNAPFPTTDSRLLSELNLPKKNYLYLLTPKIPPAPILHNGENGKDGQHGEPSKKKIKLDTDTIVDDKSLDDGGDMFECFDCGYLGISSSSTSYELTCSSCGKKSCSRCFKKSHYPSRCSDKEQKTVENLELLLLKLATETGSKPRDKAMRGLLTQKPTKTASPVKKNVGKRRNRVEFSSSSSDNTPSFLSNLIGNVFWSHPFSNDEDWFEMGSSSRYETSEQEKNTLMEQSKKEKEIATILRKIKADLGTLYNCKETPVKEIYNLIEKSSLVPFIEEKLENCNFLEIGRHQSLYSSIWSLLDFFFAEDSLSGLMDVLPGQRKSLQQLLTCLEKPAKVFIDKVGGAGVGVQLAKDFHDLSLKVTEKIKKIYDDEFTNKSDKESTSHGKGINTNDEDADVIDISDDDVDTNGNSEKVEDAYTAAMTKIQYDQVNFQFNPQLPIGVVPAKKTVLRIAQELSSLAATSTLPCSLSSSIFVRSDDSQITFLKAIITGPSGTPYMGGIFEFDIVFPNNYPSVPPKVTFKTTGGGSVRFNPNLYNCGKVCLSLLGTWSGEPWKPNSSTILQVLVSLQSLVLVAEPFFNEPGYSDRIGMERESRNYNQNVFTNNLKYAILGQLRSPPDGFADVVKSHFYYKRDSLMKEMDNYLLELSDSKNGGKGRKGRNNYGVMTSRMNDLQQLVESVRSELMKLKKP